MSALLDLEAPAQTPMEALSLRQRPIRQQTSNSRIQDERNIAKYGDTSATYWKLYASEAEISDKNFIESLRGDTNSMVFLNSLFSSIVASFIIEIYKTLLPGSSSQSNTPQSPFQPSSIAIRINVVLFISFFLSITSAVLCALIQQWCYEYLKHAYPRAAPHECGRVRTYLFQGLDRFQMRRFMYGTHVLLHLSLLLFFWAISDFFYTINDWIGATSRYCLVASLVGYLALSISPLIFSNSPYNTPLTPLIRASGILLLWPFQRLRDPRESLTSTRRHYFRRLRFNRAHLYLLEANKRAGGLERYAMEWLFEKNDFSDTDMDKFLEALPGYMSSGLTDAAQLNEYLTADYILERISEHFLTCATSLELSEEASISRVLCCVKSLQLVSQHGTKPDQNPSEADKKKLRLQKTYNERLIHDLEELCDNRDPVAALRASCIRALAIQGLLTLLAQTEDGTTQNRPHPTPLIPLYKFLFPNSKEPMQQLVDGYMPDGEEGKKMLKDLLSDGPLLNLKMLARVVHSRENAPQSSLSFCWKTFDILVKQFDIALTGASNETRVQFAAVRNETSEQVQKKERGFRIVPLRDILDVVDRGQRLLVAFSNHPEYHSRPDIVFGREHLRNGDLLKAFARCLPDYIASIGQDKRRKFMEGIICHDDLWSSLQVNLWNAQQSDVPIPDKLRVFEDCCTVANVAFSSLENSTKVDWRTTEFGSLAHQFESFINHCFQGSFMGRATSFRVGVIRARCCKAVLAQFCDDIDRDGAIFFRSQWDVASLARVFWVLGIGVGKDSDTEYWKPFINGGPIGVEFATNARETMDQATRDGSLLNFYKLGRLVTTAVPLHGSGLVPKDLEEVFDLQRNVIKDQRFPLHRASDQVWERVDKLRTEVGHLCGNLSGEDGDRLRTLLGMIDEIRSPIQKEITSSENSDAQVTVTPPSPPWKQRGKVDRSSSSSSTATTRPLSGATLTSENDYREPFVDTLPILEESTQAPLSSSYADEAGSYSLSSPLLTIQSIPSGGLMDPTTGSGAVPLSALSVYSNLSSPGNTGQRRTSPNHHPLMRSSSAFGVAGPNLSTRTSSSTLRRSRKTVPDPAISSRHVPSDLRDPGHSSMSPSPDFEVGEDE